MLFMQSSSNQNATQCKGQFNQPTNQPHGGMQGGEELRVEARMQKKGTTTTIYNRI
jgi:hypothetical protein